MKDLNIIDLIDGVRQRSGHRIRRRVAGANGRRERQRAVAAPTQVSPSERSAGAQRHASLAERGYIDERGDARRQLRSLKKALPTDDPREVAGKLSELLRRIAMARTRRREAAGSCVKF